MIECLRYLVSDGSRVLGGTQWGDRSQAVQQLPPSRPSDRDWASGSLRSAAAPMGGAGQVVPPNQGSSNSFLSSAANILMGVGLAGSSRNQEPRYDGYKQLTSSAVRRY